VRADDAEAALRQSRRATLPVRRWGLGSSPAISRSSTILSTFLCGCRTKAAIFVTESRLRGSLGERIRQCRCTRKLVFPNRAYITSEKGLRKFAN
jgi:hypothetical protein